MLNAPYDSALTCSYMFTSSFPAACMRLKKGQFLTMDHMDGDTLKIKILKSGFLHAREDQK